MKPLVFPLPGNEALADALAAHMYGERGSLDSRRFPDGESYLRFDTSVADREVVLACTLSDPDAKTLALLFAARTARELGARSIGLVAPYLAYMRQDMRFRPGEALSSRLYGAMLSSAFDWLVTVDPHLHRHASLAETLSIPATAVAAAPRLAQWIRANVPDALVVGPDEESAQWVAAVAAEARVPGVTLTKVRHGDRAVDIALPDLAAHRGRRPVLLDDIVSSGRTMAVAARRLDEAGFAAPGCVAVHALFAGDAFSVLQAAGITRIVTTDTVTHASNAIPMAEPLAIAAYAQMDALANARLPAAGSNGETEASG